MDPLGALPDEPDLAGPGLGLIQHVEVLAEDGDDRLILDWIHTEDVLYGNHGLLYHVVDLGLDE